ncbi:MAG: hypothetical protein OXN27_15410 [Candidatus Poribacteria bacterium]|nr:hypothetical protein [Candidatus Poribacteria bacterium]
MDEIQAAEEPALSQEQTNLLDELARTQFNTIEHTLIRLIEHRRSIRDMLTLEDFSSKALITTLRSEGAILGLGPQVKECVSEQRTLEADYRQLLFGYEAGLTDLIEKYSKLRDRIKSEAAYNQVINIKRSGNTKETPLVVRMPDKKIIEEIQGVDTFVKVIEVLGIEKVKALGVVAIRNRNLPLISEYKDPNGAAQRRSGSYYIAIGFGTLEKKKFLDKISAGLGIEMTVIANPGTRS